MGFVFTVDCLTRPVVGRDKPVGCFSGNHPPDFLCLTLLNMWNV